MSIWPIIFILILIVINYYYIDQFTKMHQDVKDIKKYVEDNNKK